MATTVDKVRMTHAKWQGGNAILTYHVQIKEIEAEVSMTATGIRIQYQQVFLDGQNAKKQGHVVPFGYFSLALGPAYSRLMDARSTQGKAC